MLMFVFLACLLDPIAILLAALLGWFSRGWLFILGGALVYGVAVEFLLHSYGPEPSTMVLRAVGFGAWASAVFAMRQRSRAKKAVQVNPEA
jgi:hypothetical protein